MRPGEKQLFRPVAVPWMISPSSAAIILTVSEYEEGPWEASFRAFLPAVLLNDATVKSHAARTDNPVPGDPGLTPFLPDTTNSDRDQAFNEQYRDEGRVPLPRQAELWVTVRFHGGREARLVHNHYDAIALDSRFNEYLDDPLLDADGFWDDERFWNTWIESRTCPTPGMYEAEHSFWLKGRRGDFKHVLLHGVENYVEVKAVGWTWTYWGDP